jgi:hypothetical protein
VAFRVLEVRFALEGETGTTAEGVGCGVVGARESEHLIPITVVRRVMQTFGESAGGDSLPLMGGVHAPPGLIDILVAPVLLPISH